MTDKPYADHLHKGSSTDTHKRAIELRRSETDAEKKLWSILRNRQLKGKKFRRQHDFAEYILDFYCHECKLDIELDGKHHLEKENREHDAIRTRFLEEYGINILRIWNNEVMNEPDKVIEKITAYLK